MNVDIAKLWCAALRDPTARQGQLQLGALDGSRCCLGVLCDLAVAAEVITVGTSDECVVYDGQTLSLPKAVLVWAGIRSCKGQYGFWERNIPRTLMGDNDAGRTFGEIATIIEANVKNL